MHIKFLRSLLFAVLAFVLPIQGHAQNPIALGLFGGVNIASEDFNITSDTNRTTRKGLLVTGQTDWPLHKALVLQDRLSYIQKGVEAHRTTFLLQQAKTIITELNYLELSLCPKLKIGMYDFQPYVYIGPRLGYLLSGTLETDEGSTTSREDVRRYYSDWDFGLDLGAGFSYPIIPRLYFLGDVGFGLGLSNIQAEQFEDIKSAFSRDLKVQIGLMLVAWDVSQ
jgi:hypothetical protein